MIKTLKDHHTQCRMSKGDSITVSWIPDKYAKLDSYVKLKLPNGEWDDGWRVEERYTTLPSKVVFERERDHLQTRKASDR